MTLAVDSALLELPPGADPDQVLRVTASGSAALVRSFPLEPAELLGFLTRLGTPLADYSTLISDEERRSLPGLNVVKLRNSGGQVRTHYRSCELPPHSARSWAAERPRLFAMLMVKPGWRDREPGLNGESMFIAWRQVLESLRTEDPDGFEADYRLLWNTPCAFQADNVRETVNKGPILYPVPGMTDHLDCGLRIKQDLPSLLRQRGDETIADAVDRIQQRARSLCLQRLKVLEAGDLVVIDNDRWAHGRCAFEAERQHGRNEREVWSATLS